MDRRSFLKLVGAITGIPAVLAGVVKGDEQDLEKSLTQFADGLYPYMAWPPKRYGKSPVQTAREVFIGNKWEAKVVLERG